MARLNATQRNFLIRKAFDAGVNHLEKLSVTEKEEFDTYTKVVFVTVEDTINFLNSRTIPMPATKAKKNARTHGPADVIVDHTDWRAFQQKLLEKKRKDAGLRSPRTGYRESLTLNYGKHGSPYIHTWYDEMYAARDFILVELDKLETELMLGNEDDAKEMLATFVENLNAKG